MAEVTPSSSSYQILSKCHKEAFKLISKAMDLDEKGDIKQSLALYKEGISFLERGISTKVPDSDEKFEKANSLKNKMSNNLGHAKERVEFLTLSLNSPEKTDKIDKPSSAGSGTSQRNNKPSNCVSRRHISPPRRQISNTPKPPRPNQRPATHAVHNVPKKDVASRIKNVDRELASKILDEVMDNSADVTFDDIAGNEVAKEALREIVVYPAIRPDIFSGLRCPPRGLLLFGPPGNGKTLLAKAVAYESGCVFFNITASSLMSKWVGEAEKRVRALFAMCRELAPAIIFMDEVDALLAARKGDEKDSSRRVLTEFLQEFDGVRTDDSERILVMAATNRPFELDDAALRRFPKRIYVTMPDVKTRLYLITHLLEKYNMKMNKSNIKEIAAKTHGYSASDLTHLTKDAAMGPVRELSADLIRSLPADQIRAVNLDDFLNSIKRIRPSVPPESLNQFSAWNEKYGDTSANA